MVLIVIASVVIGSVLIYGFINLVNAIFNPMIKTLEDRKKPKYNVDNPYIQAHQVRRNNDANYQEYLEWLDKNNGSLPIDKLKTEEELRFEREMNH